MNKVLIANKDTIQSSELLKCLSSYNNLKVITSLNELSVLEQYKQIRPDIFVLDTNLKNYKEIIDNLFNDINDKFNCNIILTSSNPKKFFEITNLSKVYKVFFAPFNLEEISNSVRRINPI